MVNISDLTECVKCFHFPVCSRHMGGMDLVKCEDFIPTIDVVPVVHGEWIEYSCDPNIITCSECDWGTSPEEKGFKFCPNCGAKMDGGNK